MIKWVFALMLMTAPCYAMDVYQDDMASTTGWTATATSSATATAVTEDGRTCVRLQTSTTAGSSMNFYKTIPVSGQNVEISFDSKIVNPPSNASGAYSAVGLRGNDTAANYLTAYQYSDGLYTSGTDTAGRYEIGTDLVDANTWTSWRFVVRAPTPATAVMDVWKNGVKVAESQDVSRLDGGAIYNRLVLYIGTADTTQRSIYIDNLQVRSWGLSGMNHFADLTGWTDADAGNGVSTATTFDNASVLSLSVPTASGTSLAQRQKLLGVNAIPANCVIETRIYHSSLGTRAAGNHAFINIRRLTNYLYIFYFASDGLFLYVDGTGYVEQGTDLVDIGVWTTWRFFVKTDSANSSKVYIWKNGVLVVSDATMKTSVGTSAAGRVEVNQYGYTLSGVLTYVDYLRIYSEDGTLIYSQEG